VKISIFGLGYVGAVSVACLAALGHEVIGVDVSPDKVAMVNAGQSPMIEEGLDDLLTTGIAAGRIRATSDAPTAVTASDVSLVCVGTPSAEGGEPDLAFVLRVCQEIGQALATKDAYHAIVVRSTVLPGTTEERLVPLLESASHKQAERDFGVSFNPEFLREGTAIHDFRHPPFTLIGQLGPRGGEIAAALYEDLEAPLLVVPMRVAETVKYASNAFHALKVAFANEIGALCKRQGIDGHQVMDIFCLDEKLNLSGRYLKPGFAFGGPCLPKDLRALLSHAQRLGLSLPVLEAILPSNDLQIRRGLDLVRQQGGKRIGILGLSFKPGTDDLRESPLVTLIELLLREGCLIKIFDKNVTPANLLGANRAYVERRIPGIESLMVQSVEEVLAGSQVIVIGSRAPEFTRVLQSVGPDQTVIDLVRVQKTMGSMDAVYEGICW
jgi:GDP-mannose 6-dehydrogenase